MNGNKEKQKKNDLWLMLVFLGLAAVLWIGYYVTHREPALRAEVTVDGKLVETLDLSKDQEVTIQGAKGGTNRLAVRDGMVWCEEATCPDQVCVRQGKQSKNGDIIVCLPSLMIVEVIGEDE